MCGRYAIYEPISRRTRLGFLGQELEIEPHYNAAPTLQLPVYRIREHRTQPAAPELTLMRWGLIPYWSKDKTIGARLINARAVNRRPYGANSLSA
jgi:putative SOS response-associated peptidase YedK